MDRETETKEKEVKATFSNQLGKPDRRREEFYASKDYVMARSGETCRDTSTLASASASAGTFNLCDSH